jgi:hypothetical protein
MFENIDKVNWAKLNVKYDTPATEMPQLIRKTTDADAKVRQHALDTIDRYIMSNEYILASSAAPTVPFLLEALHHPSLNNHDQARIVGILTEMFQQHQEVVLGKPMPYKSEQHRYSVAVAKEIVKGLNDYITLLGNEEPYTRNAAATILYDWFCFPLEKAELIKAAWQEFASKEKYPLVIAHIERLTRNRGFPPPAPELKL